MVARGPYAGNIPHTTTTTTMMITATRTSMRRQQQQRRQRRRRRSNGSSCPTSHLVLCTNTTTVLLHLLLTFGSTTTSAFDLPLRRCRHHYHLASRPPLTTLVGLLYVQPNGSDKDQDDVPSLWLQAEKLNQDNQKINGNNSTGISFDSKINYDDDDDDDETKKKMGLPKSRDSSSWSIIQQSMSNDTVKATASPKVEYLIFFFPIFMALTAFVTHRPFAQFFHNVCDFFSFMVWESAPGGEVLDVVRSGLNGPVVTSIAILFGTLVANTVTTLIDRNASIMKASISLSEEVRMARVMFDSFSPRYRTEANNRLNRFVERWLADFWSDQTSLASLRKLTPYLEDCIRLVHEAQRDLTECDCVATGEVYSALQRLRAFQTETMSQLQRTFPWFHYANLITLALAICVIFLIDTDPDTANSAAEPQLALSWSLLVGTFSMLFVVVADLSSPVTGITRQIFATEDLSMKSIEIYVRCWDTPTTKESLSIKKKE